tara:strand:- start:1602 stop:2159 length:558 start_codon:yes stop_codon:yes gene_type:complete
MFNSKLLVILVVIILIIFIQIISNHKKSNIHIKYESYKIKPSYGNEYYNYYIKEDDDDLREDNIEEIIVEGFSFNTDEEAIQSTHTTCPVMEGNITQITDCIHFPNNEMDGLPGSIDGGFLVSLCCSSCLSSIQTSFNNNDGIYNIIYENNNYILTKNGDNKQVVFPCDPEKREEIIRIREEFQR